MSVLNAVRGRIGRGTVWVLLGVFMLFSLFPVYWALRTSLTTNQSLLTDSGSFLPPDPTLFNYERVLGDPPLEEVQAAGGSGGEFSIFTAVRNSVIVATLITAGQVFFCALAAYAFARLKFRGRELLFAIYLSALMVPPIFALIPNFLFIRDLELDLGIFALDLGWLPGAGTSGWINTYMGLVAPFFLMTPFAVFFLRQFFIGISKEVEEAAVLDGAGHIRRFFQIILPMAAAPLATLAIITYVNAWNEFLWPFVAGKDESVRVITVALNDFRAQTPGVVNPDWTGLMTATFIAALPIMLLFVILGRRVVDAIQFSGIK
ncbi:MAG: carbohydrate ABC transporter permease [Actinomycetota bacterium]